MKKRTQITRPGGYCIMCDTVYDRQHECVGIINSKKYQDAFREGMRAVNECVGKQAVKNYDIVNIDKTLDAALYERQTMNEASAHAEIDKAVKNYGRIDFESKLVCEIWNEAIEAAAELFPYGEWEEINIAAKIRRLKK